MKYRMLRKNERPDKTMGDQYHTPSVKRDLWHATSLRGKSTVEECNRAGNPCVYRRPLPARKPRPKGVVAWVARDKDTDAYTCIFQRKPRMEYKMWQLRSGNVSSLAWNLLGLRPGQCRKVRIVVAGE